MLSKTLASRREEATQIDATAFRDALGRFASGVTVITTLDGQGGIHGMTATAFSSLSLSPPLVLVAVALGSRCHRRVIAERRFGVSFLTASQVALSRHFGGQPSATTLPRFATLGAVPVLADAMVKLACEVQNAVEGGDHSIFVGRVIAISANAGEPLLHYDGDYHTLGSQRND